VQVRTEMTWRHDDSGYPWDLTGRLHAPAVGAGGLSLNKDRPMVTDNSPRAFGAPLAAPPGPAPASSADDRALLNELEPEAARLYDRHAKVAQEWFPHDYIPYRLGRDFDKEPWTPDQPRLSGVAQTSFEVNLLTEDNLPSYHRLIHGMFGGGDGAWINWIGRWTAEEGRHAIVLRDYLTVTRNLDPIALERGRMAQLQAGYDRDTIDTLRGLAYVAFQELATRISHKNTGRYSQDPVADKIMTRIAADENLHMVFYRDILAAALKIQPSRAVQAIVAEVLAFEMPGNGIPGFLRKAAAIAKAGIYDIRIHRDEVLMPIIKYWRIFDLTGLDAAAEEARRRLAEHLDKLEVTAKRFEEKMALANGGTRLVRVG
jgi:acyl-[acyl-carrier-protein] desaturase